jgi:hypothetical protein
MKHVSMKDSDDMNTDMILCYLKNLMESEPYLKNATLCWFSRSKTIVLVVFGVVIEPVEADLYHKCSLFSSEIFNALYFQIQSSNILRLFISIPFVEKLF